MEVVDTPKAAGEKETLAAFLQLNRATLLWKTEGLSDELARQAPFASDLSVIGVLAHLALVESAWFISDFGGRPIDYLADFGYDFDADIDAEWHLTGTETLADARAKYISAIDAVNEVIAAADLEDLSATDPGTGHFTLRWTILHLIEEVARHAGHVDVLREYLDQSTGYLPPREDVAS